MRLNGIDIEGRWTQRQVKRVLEVTLGAAFVEGVALTPIDITTHADSVRWFIIVVHPWDHLHMVFL